MILKIIDALLFFYYGVSGLLLYPFMKCLNISYYSDDKRVDGQTVIVTGANTGIGYEVAKELALKGDLFINPFTKT